MEAKELIKAGKLSDARKILIEKLKNKPNDTAARTLLFQVLIFSGEWDKADRHLEALATASENLHPAINLYQTLTQAERERQKIARNEQLPTFLPESPQYFSTFNEAFKRVQESDFDAAKSLLLEADKQRPEISGTLNGKKFSGFRDTDTRLIFFLEAFAHGRYVWIPFEFIRELTISEPETLFDLIWAQSTITTWAGLTLNCFVPVLYPDSFSQQDERVKLGRMTDWVSIGGSFTKAVGQHVFEVGDEDVALLDIRKVEFNYPEPEKVYEANS